jgi:hypothetical protein
VRGSAWLVLVLLARILVPLVEAATPTPARVDALRLEDADAHGARHPERIFRPNSRLITPDNRCD